MRSTLRLTRPHVYATLRTYFIQKSQLHQIAPIKSSDTAIDTKDKDYPASFSLSYKYNKFLGFRQKADTRIGILRKIIPREYRMNDMILFNCIYFDPCNIIQTKHVDQFHEPVFLPQKKVVLLGEKTLGHELEKFAFRLLTEQNRAAFEKDDNLSLDLFSDARELAGQMNSMAVRRTFISQFLNMYEDKGLLEVDVKDAKSVSIKIPEDVRQKVLTALIGFMALQVAPEKFNEFVAEFIIKGRHSKKKKYKHKGLYELYRDRQMSSF